MKQNTLIGAAVAVAAVGLIIVVSHNGKKSDDQPTPSASVSVSTSPKASSTASPTVSPTRTPVRTATPTAMPTLTPTPTATPTPTPATIGFEKATYSVDEDEGPVILTVTRTGNLSNEASVEYASAPGTAGADDYGASHGTLTFGAGVASRTISVNITDDDMLETNETFSFTLSGASIKLGMAATTITIVDDESNQ